MPDENLTPEERRARQMDRDKRILEAAIILYLLGLIETAQDHAAQAIRLGVDPSVASSAVLIGNDKTHQPGIGVILAGGIVRAFLMGFFRSLAIASEVGNGKPIVLAGIRETLAAVPDVLNPPARYQRATAEILDRAGGAELIGLRMADATRQVDPIVRGIDARVNARLGGVTVEGQAGRYTPRGGAGGIGGTYTPPAVSEAAQKAREAFEAAGVGTRTSRYVDSRKPAAGETNVGANIEAIVEGVVGIEYDKGRDVGLESPAGRAMLWGYSWQSLLDSRTTQLCRSLNGVRLPREDEFWNLLRPPAHWGCRSVRVPVFVREGEPPPKEIPSPLSPEDTQKYVEIRRRFRAAIG